MQLNRRIAIAMCAQACNVTPDVILQKIENKEISMQQLISQCLVFTACQPLSAEALGEMLFPGKQETKRKTKHDNTNNQTFELLLKMKQTADESTNETPQAPAEKSKPKASKPIQKRRSPNVKSASKRKA